MCKLRTAPGKSTALSGNKRRRRSMGRLFSGRSPLVPGQQNATMELDLQNLEAAHPEPHPLLLELEQHGRKDGVPIVPRETGRLLSTVVSAMQANRILEIGTAYGYSTLWMALAQ